MKPSRFQSFGGLTIAILLSFLILSELSFYMPTIRQAINKRFLQTRHEF